MSFRKILCVDFDGVLHSYTSGWQGADVCPDPPVPGAMEWLRCLFESDDFEPQIYSSRSREPAGIRAMQEWLIRHGNFKPEEVEQIKFPTQKPAAFLTIDDRAICFDGNFPTRETMAAFKPWNKRD